MSDRPTVCLLHADVHVMSQECWGTTVDWYADHQHLDATSRRNAYQAEAERAMLTELAVMMGGESS